MVHLVSAGLILKRRCAAEFLSESVVPYLCVIMAPKMKLPNKGGKGSKTPTPKRKVVPECKLNRNFDDRLETFAEKKMWPERGIDLESLRNTPIPATVNDMG